ncbi:MAG: bifunctional adenosylcobinamide kinase/adenosylcobinamide-phosphate guanylyltransferase [Dehalococcoidia bacterium]|nr:bifunctional adenosylcobinamide kinase/adenosylcobinamide-phosphate guanylyltransferase [Dehalococcoidia bacterium]
MAKQIILLLGGARSGKSHYAQQLAMELGGEVLFVATGEALDEEMQARIAEHKKDRPPNWRTLEMPTGIGKVIEKGIGDAKVVIIDCLTLLISNLLHDEPEYPEAEKRVLSEINQLIAVMDKLNASFVIVSNEVGMGLVPGTKLGRIYRDLLGKANQLLASHATEVYLMVACLPVQVKKQV